MPVTGYRSGPPCEALCDAATTTATAIAIAAGLLSKDDLGLEVAAA